ncbi:hypothetical protein TKK_0013206 [Trichogramma kaykai]
MSKSNFKDDSGLRYGSKDVFERYKGRSPDYSSELKRMLDEEELDWENEEQRYYFSCRLYFLIKNWKSQLPDLRQFLRNDQMDWLITEDVKNKYDPNHANKGTPIINFVIKTGYKDKTEIDNDGKPILRRTTAIHLAAKNGYNLVAPLLFKIYDSFDANYVDEDDSAGGLTHFHAACAFGYEKIVEKFLEAGQDPNCPLSDDPPLHLALKHEHKKVVEVLLKRGANPNSTSRSGQKSLQIAVANLAPDSVKLLLDHGADLADFAFPAGSQFNERLATVTSKGHSMKLEIASLIMMIVEHLERRGYAFAPNRSDVLTIVELLSKYEWFNQFSIEYWLSNEDFVIKAKELKMKPSLSLYDFVRLPAEQATRLVTYKEYFKFAQKSSYRSMAEPPGQTCSALIFDIMLRGFCRRWALEHFLSLTQHQLPILCCEKIIGQLTNEDLLNICLAAASSKNRCKRMASKIITIPLRKVFSSIIV